MKELGGLIIVVGIICTFASGWAYWAHMIWLAGAVIFNCAPKTAEPTVAADASPITPPPTPPPPPPPKLAVAVSSTPPKARFFVYLSDSVKGPYTVEQIQALEETGALSSDSQVCREGTQDWKPLSRFSI